VYKQLCVFSPLCTTLRPEDGRARPKHVVTIGSKIQNQDSCVFRQTPPPSFGSRLIYFDDIIIANREHNVKTLSVLCGQNEGTCGIKSAVASIAHFNSNGYVTYSLGSDVFNITQS
jgi:hypothetical protein